MCKFFSSKLIQVFFFGLIMLSLSCQSVVTPTDPIIGVNKSAFYTENGVLHISDISAYEKTVESVRLLSPEDKISFGKRNNFTSFFQVYYEILQDLDTTKKDSYKDYVTFSDGNFNINFVSYSLATLANKDGLLYIGDALIRFVDDKEIVVKDGDIAKAMNWKNSHEVIVYDTDNHISTQSGSKNARISSLCRRIYGRNGSGGIFSDAANVETRIKKTYVPVGLFDLVRVYVHGISKGVAENTSWFGSHSRNNYLTVAYIADAYDWNNQLVTSYQIVNMSTNSGDSITSEDPLVYVSSCYSAQAIYYYVNLRPITSSSPLLPTFTKYVNDKFTVTADCTGDSFN